MGFKLLELAATYALMALAERNSAIQAKFDFALGTGEDSQAFVYAKYKAAIGSKADLCIIRNTLKNA